MIEFDYSKNKGGLNVLNTNRSISQIAKSQDTELVFRRLKELSGDDFSFVSGFILGLSTKNAQQAQENDRKDTKQ
ncbi:hypothetical protein [Butyricicoccus pullicaecorum]|uniref:hypothetical protein n=1 Tax=Butyricicoccus pullicaecorum TaxID=501571 RepID=UPI003990DB00